MAEFESPKKKKPKTPKKKKEESENLQETINPHPNERVQDLKRKSQSSSDNEAAVKKPKTAAAKITNGHVDASPGASPSKWTLKEEEDLLEKVEEYLKNREEAEGTKKPIYIKHMDWSKIDCGDHTPEEAQQRFLTISHRVRKIRTAREVVQDMQDVLKKTASSVKKKDTIDPELPKKPHTPYIRFVMAKRNGIVERHPEMNNPDIARKLGSKWKKLSEEKKKKYLDVYHEEMEDYTAQLMDYLKKHNPGINPPKTKFELWAEEEKKKIKQDRPEISEKKLAKKLRRRWENLEEEEKEKWEKKEKKEQKNFRDRISRAKKRISGHNLESSSEAKSDI